MLPLTRGEASRVPPKDHEAALDLGEAFPLSDKLVSKTNGEAILALAQLSYASHL